MTHPLKTYRKNCGLTLAALAAMTGLSKSHLSLIENGRAPGRKTIEAIVARTGLNPAVFFQPSSQGAAGHADGAHLGGASAPSFSSSAPESSTMDIA